MRRQPDDLELALLVNPTTVREPQDIERFRLALPLVAPPLSRLAAKLNKAGLYFLALAVFASAEPGDRRRSASGRR
ncbi:MAG: hypothetical protein R2729_25205 [Bryobacteraceae bacterium]